MGAPKRPRRKGRDDQHRPTAEEDRNGHGDTGPGVLVEASHLSLINPTNLSEACEGDEAPFWSEAMEREVARLKSSGVIQAVVPPPVGQDATDISAVEWVFARQIKNDLANYRCRAVVAHQDGRADEAAMGSMPAFRTVLAFGASMGMRFRHLSVDITVPLPEAVYVKAPNSNTTTWKLQKMLRGMKGSAKAIDGAIRDCLLACDFKKCSENGVFVLPSPQGRPRAIVFQCGDELLVASWTAGLNALMPIIKNKLIAEGATVDDLGEPALFMGIGVECFPQNCDVLLQQNHYMDHILDAVPELESWRECTVPMAPETLEALAAAKPTDATSSTNSAVDRKWWRKVIGQLSWLARCTRPDIAFAVAYLSRFSSLTTLGPVHRAALFDVLSYLRTGHEFEFKLGAEEDSIEPHETRAYTHGFVTPSMDKCHIGWCLLLDGSTIDWASHKSNVAQTELEADLFAQGEGAHRLTWLGDLLSDLGVPASKPSLLLGDNCGIIENQAALAGVLQSNKHLLSEYQFMLDLESKDSLRLHECDDGSQPAKLCSMTTKGAEFTRFCLMYGLERQFSVDEVDLWRGGADIEELASRVHSLYARDLA